jgi:hypothetical protein
VANAIELVMRDGRVDVVVDGTLQPASATGKYWMPRFREQEVAVPPDEWHPNDEPGPNVRRTRRVLAPVFVSVRVEDGQVAPVRTVVTVLQKVVDDGAVLTEGVELLRKEIKPYSTNDLSAEVHAVPYPMIITKPPTVVIQDNDALRRWQYKERLWRQDRAVTIVERLLSFLTTRNTRIGGQGQGTGRARRVFSAAGSGALRAALSDRGPSRWGIVWRILSVTLSPKLYALFEVASTVYQLRRNQFEDDTPPPEEAKLVEMSLNEFASVLRRIAETRAGGSMLKDPDMGLSPISLAKENMVSEAAVLYWLLYGGAPLEPDAPRSAAEAPAGNVLDSECMDPRFMVKSRVELAIQLEMWRRGEDAPTRIEFSAIRANGVDAGWLASGYDMLLCKVRSAARAVRDKLTDLNKITPNWLTDRLLVTDSKQGRASKAGTDPRSFFEMWTDDDSRRRWYELTKAGRNDALGQHAPLVIDVAAFLERLETQIIGRLETQADVDSRQADISQADAALQAKYADYLEKAVRLYRLGTGIKDAIQPTDLFFRRWLDVHFASSLSAAGFRGRMLHAFVVPRMSASPTDPLVCEPDLRLVVAPRRPPVVRRLPQIADFKTAGLAMPAQQLLDDPFTKRVYARAAAKAAASAISSFEKWLPYMLWTIEASETSEMHPLQIYGGAGAALGRLAEPAFALPLPGLPVDTTGMSGMVSSRVDEALLLSESTSESGRAWKLELASGDAASGIAAVLRETGIPGTRVEWEALVAFVEIVCFRATAHGALLQREDLVRSCVKEAMAEANAVAQMIQLAYGKKSNRFTLLYEDDIFFGCLPSGDYARCALRHLGFWMRARLVQRPAQRPAATADGYLRTWPLDHREGAQRFADALKKLGGALKTTPASLPMLNVQSMWVSSNRFATSAIMPPSSVPWEPIQVQVAAAAASFNRVRAALYGAQPPVQLRYSSLAALSDCIASRPVVFIAYADRASRPDVLRALAYQPTYDAQKRWTVPEAGDRDFQLRVRYAGLRTDVLEDTRDEPAATGESASALIDRFSDLALQAARPERAVYVVPPGAVRGLVTPSDVGHDPVFEDRPVWIANALQATRELLSDIAYAQTSPMRTADSIQVEHNGGRSGGQAESPHTIRVHSRTRLSVHLDRIQSLRAELRQPWTAPLPSTIMDALKEMERSQPAQVACYSGTMKQQTAALLWNADRLYHAVAILTSLRIAHGKRVVLAVPGSWSSLETEGVVVSLALSSALAKSEFATELRVRPDIPPQTRPGCVVALERLQAALVAAALEDISALPMCEVALVAASLST